MLNLTCLIFIVVSIVHKQNKTRQKVKEAYLYLFEYFGYGFTVEFLTRLFVGREDLLHRHILGCKTEKIKEVIQGLLVSFVKASTVTVVYIVLVCVNHTWRCSQHFELCPGDNLSASLFSHLPFISRSVH